MTTFIEEARHLGLTHEQITQILNLVSERIIGEEEDLNAPLNREIDGNPESDKYPLLYVIRRAVRNVHREQQRTTLYEGTKEESE